MDQYHQKTLQFEGNCRKFGLESGNGVGKGFIGYALFLKMAKFHTFFKSAG